MEQVGLGLVAGGVCGAAPEGVGEGVGLGLVAGGVCDPPWCEFGAVVRPLHDDCQRHGENERTHHRKGTAPHPR